MEHINHQFSRQVVSQTLINLIPFIGFLLGIMTWLIAAYIDSTYIKPDKEFLTAVFTEDTAELWMRSLVAIVIICCGIAVQYFLRRQYKFETLLIEHQHHLEQLVEERTRELEQLANFDELTKIYNRRKATELFEYEAERANRYAQPLSLILFDIDHFKFVNDRYGHNEGDRILKTIGIILQENLRQTDIFARWGGEEFVILMPHTQLDTARNAANKLMDLLSTLTCGADNNCITASFGIAQLKEKEQTQSLIKRADDAMYQAKNNGPNRISIAS
ncbi:MAG: diguanylate cyclase [Thioalkalispiraceae bacterium]|jgi:diguanylate cyclase (GGDEF)-like protein